MEKRIKQLDRLGNIFVWLMANEIISAGIGAIGLLDVSIISCMSAAFLCYAANVICNAVADIIENQMEILRNQQKNHDCANVGDMSE